MTLPPGEYRIGSDPGAELHAVADGVASFHALLTIHFDHALIEDIGSEEGTLVNGRRITECLRLWPNQKIQTGTAILELRRPKMIVTADDSFAPQSRVVREALPEHLLHEKKYDIGGVGAQAAWAPFSTPAKPPSNARSP